MAYISTRHLVDVFRRVGVSLRAGVDILRVWEVEAGRGSPRHRDHMRNIHKRIRAGDSLAEALTASNGYFPPLALELVRVGERTGHLDAVLLRLADHYDHLLQLRRDFFLGILWPMIQLVLAILVIGLFIWIMGIIGPSTDMLGWGLVGTRGVVIYFLFVIAIGASIVLLIMSLARGWFGPTPVRIAMKIPLAGPFLESNALARFTWSLAVALDAGLDARDCMRMALRSTQNPVYTSTEATCDRVLARHDEFTDALREAGVFPRELVDTLNAAEIAGTHSESLLHLSRTYEERAKDAARVLAIAASWAVWLMVAGLIIFMIFKLAMTYFGAINEALEMTR
jgi:type II secretory pathway component PulF